jgi:organic radical activating enzyme
MTKKLQDMDWVVEPGGAIGNNEHNVNQVKELLNSKGCGFCMAKFKQVTMHLGTGMTHSCHHPVPHKIPLSEIENNPAALFNTSVLKTARKEMLNDQKPSECDYCWRVEESDGVSDRHYKSLEPWAITDFDETIKLTGDEDIYPSYLEVSFSNACNLACTYCGPEFSSKWVEDLKNNGPLKLYEGQDNERWVQGYQDLDSLSYKNREFNPYIDAFWKWFPEAYKHLKHFRITGGEPLMSKETLKTMDFFIENPNPELEFSINSNLSVPDKIWDKFIEKLKVLKTDNKVKKITLYTSVEGWGEKAEYARTGLDFELLRKRFEQVLKLGNVRVVIMSTFNLFSITSFKDLLKWVHRMKQKYNPDNTHQHLETSTGFNLVKGTSYTQRKEKNPDHSVVVGIDIPYLRHPEFLDVQICSHELVEDYLLPCLDYINQNSNNGTWADHQSFEQYEVEKLKRIVVHRLYHNRKKDKARESHADIKRKRSAFYEFVNKLDSRRGTSFLKTFPEMTEFYNLCKRDHNTYMEWREMWKKQGTLEKYDKQD